MRHSKFFAGDDVPTLFCVEDFCTRPAEMLEFTNVPLTFEEFVAMSTGNAWCQDCWARVRPYEAPP
jgi:hypothetical protein